LVVVASEAFAAGQVRQPLLFLLGRAEEDDGEGAQGRGRQAQGDAAAGLGELLHHQHQLEAGAAEAAVVRVEVDAEQVRLAQLLHDLPGKGVLGVVLLADGLDLFFGDLAGRLDDGLLVFCEEIVHDVLLRRSLSEKPPLFYLFQPGFGAFLLGNFFP
jgi:signal transduction histidine kinase